MAVINQYKANFKIDDSLEIESVYCNATSMSKAIEMLSKERNDKEPISIMLTTENVLTEPSSETTINLSVVSKTLDSSGVIVLDSGCNAYPTSIENAKRGDSVYLSAVARKIYKFSHWELNDTVISEENPLMIRLPLDESVETVTYTAIFEPKD